MARICLTVMMLSLGGPSFAQEYVNNEFRFAITLAPDQGWTPAAPKTAAAGTLTKPQLLLIVARKPSGEAVSVNILDVGERVSLDADEYRAGFKNGALKSFPPTMRFVSEKRATFAGVPSYELMVAGTLQDVPMNIRLVAIVANRYQYNVIGYARDPASLTGGEVARALASFRFTDAPQVPRGTTPREFGEMVGRLTVDGVLIVVAWLIVRMVVKWRHKARTDTA